jgi:RNA polymerase sigma factor (sigma-70 family)
MASQRKHAELSNERKAELLERLMRRHWGTLIRQAGFHSESTADADDALSDASVQFLRRFPGNDDKEALRWMLVVVKRCAWEMTSRRRRRREATEEVFDLARGRRGPEEMAEVGEEVERFLAALATLKPDESRTLLLIAAGYRYVEVGRICGWSQTKVNRCAAEGRLRLRKLLTEGGEIP